MTGSQQSILIDARLNAWPGAQGHARSVLKLTEHMGQGQDVLALRVLVNRSDPQLFPLAGVSERAELVDTDIGPTTMHRSRELGRLIRDVGAAVFYAPHPLFAPTVCACPMVVGVHDCASYGSAARARPRHPYPAVARPTLIPNGVEVSQFADVTGRAVTAAQLRYGLPELFILTVGSHRPHNDHGVLIRALALMPPIVSLVIVGYSEPYFGDLLRQQISDLGMGSRVRLVPAVT